jgi:hypothetical protein
VSISEGGGCHARRGVPEGDNVEIYAVPLAIHEPVDGLVLDETLCNEALEFLEIDHPASVLIYRTKQPFGLDYLARSSSGVSISALELVKQAR